MRGAGPYQADPDLVVVEENETVYLIPLLKPPLRLNQTGSEVWRLLSDGQTFPEIVHEYSIRFACTAVEAENEVRTFMEYLLEQGVIGT